MMPFGTPLVLVDWFCVVEKLIEMLDKKGIKVVHKEAFAPTIFKHQKELAKYVLTQAQELFDETTRREQLSIQSAQKETSK